MGTKQKIILICGAVFILLAACTVAYFQGKMIKSLTAQNATLTTQITDINETLKVLAGRETTAYRIELAPQITNKVTTTFGSTKSVVFQYYFTMDGNKIEVKPDSVYMRQRID